jgi:hypothetical protein
VGLVTEFVNLDVRLKAGKFSGTEDEQLKQNWHEYCEYSGADPSEAPNYMGCANDRVKKKGSKYFRAWMCKLTSKLHLNREFFRSRFARSFRCSGLPSLSSHFSSINIGRWVGILPALD